MRLRRAPKHTMKRPPQFENPAKNWQFIRHMHSPWALIALMIFQIILLVLIMVLFGYAKEFSDYLNSRGDFADRQQTEETAAVCQLIGLLHADPAGQLQQIATELNCPNGPLPPRADAGSSPSSVPIGPTPSFSTSQPTRSSGTPTGTATGPLAAGNGPPGTMVPAPPGGPSRTTSPPATEPPPSASPTTPGGGSPSPTPDPSPTLCVPLTGLCVTL